MRKVDIAALMQRTEAVEIASYLEAGPRLAAGAGTFVGRFNGITCLGARAINEPFLNRALGFGTIAEATPRLLERIERHYAALNKPSRVSVAVGSTPQQAVRLLERRGYEREIGDGELIYGYLRSRLPRMPAVPGLAIERVDAKEAALYASLAVKSFDDRGPMFETIVETLVRDPARRRKLSAYLGRVDGVPAATGMLFDVRPVGGMGNGSVAPKFRGRGIQTAMIAFRMHAGWKRGLRYFFGQTINPVSARNLEELGWRLLYTEVDWVRSAR